MSKKDIYTGIRPLNEALNSISIGHSDGRPVKSPRPTTIKKQEYDRVRERMNKYSSRLTLDKSGKITGMKGKPVLPTEKEMKRDLGMTWGKLNAVARNNDDVGAAFHYNTDISEEQKRNLESAGLSTGVTYVALGSQYPFLSNVFKKK